MSELANALSVIKNAQYNSLPEDLLSALIKYRSFIKREM